MIFNKKTFAILFTAASVAVTAPAFAHDYDDDEIHYQQNQHQYISYEKAAQIATNKIGAGSYAKDVEFEKKFNGTFFDVEVIDAQGREFDVRLDAKTGKVIYTKRDD